MCRHFEVMCRHLVISIQKFGLCLYVSTLQCHVSTPSILWTLSSCVDTSNACVDTFNSRLLIVHMCRHFHFKLSIVHRHLQFLGHCLQVSTPRIHVSTLLISDCLLSTCVDTSIFDCLLSTCVDSSKCMCRHFNSRLLYTVFMCWHFKNMCQHFLPRTYFLVFLGHLSIDQFKFFKRSSFWIYTIFKNFNPVRFIAFSMHRIFNVFNI